MCHMWLVMSTGFHAELHRRRCGVVVRSRCQDMEARAAGGLGWGSGCNGGRWEAILSENPTFWQWTLSSLKIIYIAVVEALLRWDMAISCHVLQGIGAALWDLRMLVSMRYWLLVWWGCCRVVELTLLIDWQWKDKFSALSEVIALHHI